MTRLAFDLDDAGELPEAPGGDGSLAGYDAWKGATPPEYEFLGERPGRERRRPVEPWMCQARLYPQHRWLCTRPANHNGGCNNFGEES